MFDFTKSDYNSIINSIDVYDVRYPTSLTQDGSDAVHVDPNYSCAYVVIKTTNPSVNGHGFTFTCGRGTEIICFAIRAFRPFLEGKVVRDIFSNFGVFWQSLANESQLRWLGPEKGVIHLALAAIVNGLWHIWATIEQKPLWKLLTDMEPEEIISLIDFRHITDAITEKEALEILRGNNQTKQQRVTELESSGMPAYITSVGWMGYSNEKIERLTKEALAGGWTSFKMKVGISLENDHERAKFIRQLIGPDKNLMMDANQKWDVSEAISWMTSLAEFNPLWIEEPTSPDDVLGHAEIGKALKSAKIGIATGEHCQNRVMFKQFLKSGAMDFCQIDGCRVGGVNENIAIMLMAAKYKVPVCPHAGGVGLCELVTHLPAFNYACIAPTWKNTMIEFADHLHEHFVDPAVAKNGRYSVPMKAGYAEMMAKSRDDHVYPEGQVWQKLFSEGKFTPPS